MDDYQKKIEDALISYLPSEEVSEQILVDSMKYSLLNGGKRVRPLLTLEFCKLCGGNIEDAMPFACAVEMIHTYSLIHDDLPCMDDDDYRRGKKSNHKVFGEDIALLAGDALQSTAFSIMSNSKVDPKLSLRAINILSNYCGTLGMVGGQVIDLTNENKKASLEVLEEMDKKKTAALIQSACEMGCVIANASEAQINAASEYAYSIGIAFQIVDDILDCTKTTDELGKPAGSDDSNNKSTYVSLLGIDECKVKVSELTEKAIKALDAFDNDTSFLKDFAYKLRDRQK